MQCSRLHPVTGQFPINLVTCLHKFAHARKKMSGQKQPAGSELDGGPPRKKRGITAKTVDKWIAENDKALNTTTWLQYDKVDREYVTSLKCSMCIRFQDKLLGARTTQPIYIIGSKNLRASAFKDHAKTDMHQI